jgi:toxin ParE1/3/4
MPTVYRRPAARRDVIEHFVYLAENADENTADRFLANVEDSFNQLAEQPKIGAPLALRRPELIGLRKWRVHEFDNVLIYYLPRSDGVSIVRVLHAARDWWSLLGIVPWVARAQVGHGAV